MRPRLAVLLAFLVTVPAAGASIFIGTDVVAPRLAVDAKGVPR
jgi:hypothetical protein